MSDQPGNRPLRVALLCHYLDDDAASAGGPWTVGRNLALGMAAAGAEVHVVTYRGASRGHAMAMDAGGSLAIHPLEISPVPGVPRQLAVVPQVAASVRALAPDAVTAHAPEYVLGALRAGFPTAFTIHGVVRQEFRVFRRWQLRLPLLLSMWQDWQAARQVGHIVALNRYVIEQYRTRTAAQFHRIDNPIDDVFFQAPELEPQPRSLLLVGALSERKDPLTLLEAVALVKRRFPDVQLRVAGQVRLEGYGEDLRAFVDRAGLAGNVRFLGPLNQAQLAAAYAASALTVLSSRQETAPLVLMEAMACRRPVVATAVGGVREIVAEGESGFVVPPGDAATMAARIERILGDPVRGTAMGRAGRALAEARFRREIVAEHYLALLQRLAAE